MKAWVVRKLGLLGAAIGACVALSALPSTAHAQCNHVSGRWLDADAPFVPISATMKATAAGGGAARHDDEAGTRHKSDQRRQPIPCQGCFNCNRSPANAPTSISSGGQVLDLWCPSSDLRINAAFVKHFDPLALDHRLPPVFAIEHPPRTSFFR